MKYSSLTPDNAKPFFELYLSQKDKALSYFFAEFEKSELSSLKLFDYKIDCLIPLWLWIKDLMPKTNTPCSLNELPPWYDFAVRSNPQRDIEYTPESARIIDGLAYFWGEMLIKNIPDLKWDIGAYPRSLGYCAPIVQSEYFGEYPLHSALSLAYISNHPDNPGYKPKILLDAMYLNIATEREYRATYIKNGGHTDPRMKRRTIFK